MNQDKTKQLICANVNPSVQKCPGKTGPSQTGLDNEVSLSANSVLDLAVDSTELVAQDLLLLGNHFLDLANKLIEVLLHGLGSTSLVATLGNDLGVVGGTTTVPGEEL